MLRMSHKWYPIIQIIWGGVTWKSVSVLISDYNTVINVKVVLLGPCTCDGSMCHPFIHCLREYPSQLNTLRPRQNGRHFADDIFKCIFFNENFWIPIKISLKFVPKGPINNIPALVQIMAWRRPGDKPLSEPMMVSLLTHICVTRPQWVNTLRLRQNGCHFPDGISKRIFFSENCSLMKISLKFVPQGPINNIPTLVQIMAWRWSGDKPLSEPMMD